MIVALAQVHLRIDGAQSLKDKRQVLRSTIDRIRRLGVAASEVADQDLWNRATIGIACVSSQTSQAQGLQQAALRIVEELASAVIEGVETDLVHFGG